MLIKNDHAIRLRICQIDMVNLNSIANNFFDYSNNLIVPDYRHNMKDNLILYIIMNMRKNLSKWSNKRYVNSLILEQDYEMNEDSLVKIEDLAQQAVDWRVNFNTMNQFSASDSNIIHIIIAFIHYIIDWGLGIGLSLKS